MGMFTLLKNEGMDKLNTQIKNGNCYLPMRCMPHSLEETYLFSKPFQVPSWYIFWKKSNWLNKNEKYWFFWNSFIFSSYFYQFYIHFWNMMCLFLPPLCLSRCLLYILLSLWWNIVKFNPTKGKKTAIVESSHWANKFLKNIPISIVYI